MKKYVLLLTVSIFLIASFAYAESSLIWNGTEFSRGCNLVIKVFNGEKVTEDENNLSFYTNGYLNGFIQAHEISGMPHGSKGDYCMPNNVYPYHIATAAVNYMKNHPEELVKKPNEILLNTLVYAYPCKKK